MVSSPDKTLATIRIQTARMLEIYALLRRQLDEGAVHLPREKHDQLSGAIRTIARNMLELQSFHATTAQKEQNSGPSSGEEVTSRRSAPFPSPSLHARATDASLARVGTASVPSPVSASELQELDEIVDQVLRWHIANGDMV